MPFNIELVLASSQLSCALATPTRPRATLDELDSVFTTPSGPQDIQRALWLLQQSEFVSRSTRTVFAKAGKAIAIANTKAARFKTVYNQLKAEAKKSKSKRTRKRIQIDLN